MYTYRSASTIAPALSDGMISRSMRSEKSVAWMSENVSGVSAFLRLPREVVARTIGEEFHSLNSTG